MMVFLLPLGLCQEMENLMNEYWWSGTIGAGKGIRWRSWAGLCMPKSKGGMGFRKLHETNLSLLGKQAWRLLTKPDSLVARVYKARYYSQSSFLEARMGSNPSYIWRSLMAVQSVLHNGVRTCIGNGTSTIIGRDPWLPDDENSYVTTDLHDSIAQAPVSSLFNMQGEGWDSECVRDVFDARDADLILNLPLSHRKPPDSWMWPADPKGRYTVKSCYRRLIGEVVDGRSWTKLWNMQSEETAYHLFAECPEVKNVWNAVGLPVSNQETILYGMLFLMIGTLQYMLLFLYGLVGRLRMVMITQAIRMMLLYKHGFHQLMEAEAATIREALSWVKELDVGDRKSVV